MQPHFDGAHTADKQQAEAATRQVFELAWFLVHPEALRSPQASMRVQTSEGTMTVQQYLAMEGGTGKKMVA